MKKPVIVLSAALIATALISLPASAEVSFSYGVKGGLSLSQISFTGEGSSEGLANLAKPVFGAFFALNLGPALSIQPEVYYLKQGVARNQTLDDTEMRTVQVLSYIHVPVLARMRFMKGGKLKPVVFAGPAVSFLTTAVQSFYENGVLGDEYDLKPFLKSTNFSVAFGGGLEYDMKKVILVFDIRYDLGLVDIDKASAETTMKTKAFLVMAGIGF